MSEMLVGHVDGKGSVYDESGKVILGAGEQLLLEVMDDNLDVSEGSGFWNMKTLFPSTAEKGTLYVTDQRLVFVRTPNPILAAKEDAYQFGMADAIANAVRARDLKKMSAREFCQIDYDEIDGFWVKNGKVGAVFLRSSPHLTRKAIIYRRSKDDRKLHVLRGVLERRLPMTEPENRKGSFLLGTRLPFMHRRGSHMSSER